VFEALMLDEELKRGSSDEGGSFESGVRLDGRRVDRMGEYRLLREIGRGGMGVVYEAEQEALGRRVALKVLPATVAGDSQARLRFQREARAAARMHHTNIVPVFDVGQDGGHLYYAMQMIDGQGLDRLISNLRRLREQGQIADAARNRPPPEKSLAVSLLLGRFEPQDLSAGETTIEGGELSPSRDPAAIRENSTAPPAVLPGTTDVSTARGNRRAYYRSVAQIGLQTASALAYAHVRGVVHRDIKPSNLLVDSAGVVWVTDFGLAKTGDVAMTETGDILGTIRYMSPERFRGQCDGRADVYSLGLTLYEMLTLEPAFSSPDRLQLIEQIRQVEPASARSRDARLPRDLETIVLKAIDKDPRRRYQTADELADDLQRFIADEPIRARRISPVERIVRWSRRNRAVAILAATVFLLLVGGMAITSWQAHRARRAERAALAAAAAERAANESAQKSEAETRSVLEFVENEVFAAARPEGLWGGLGREVKLRQAVEAALPHLEKSFAQQPLIEARLRRTLGMSFLYLGDPGIAAAQLEKARALYTRHRGPDHPDTLASTNDLALSYRTLGRRDEALKLDEDTLARARATLGPDHPITLKSMNSLAITYWALGRHAEALKLNEQTLALSKAKLGADHSITLASMNNLANSYRALGRLDEALKLRQDTLALRKATLGPDHPDTLASMNNLAISYMVAGRLDEALKLNLETVELKKAKLGIDHPDTLLSLNNLANSYSSLGRYADAFKLYEETLVLSKPKLGADHPGTLRTMNSLANTYGSLGRHADAIKLHEETLAMRKAKLGADHPDTLLSMYNLAFSYVAVGRHADALKLHQEALARRQAKFGPDHPDTLLSRINVARCLLQLGRGADAAVDCVQTAQKFEKLKRTDVASLYTAACYRALAAAALRSAGNSPEAAKQSDSQADQAMTWLKQAVATGHMTAAKIAEDHDLDALRDRDDFKKLAAELDAKTKQK
jgi:eukaryotic-like serine/threonine-protein kinase